MTAGTVTFRSGKNFLGTVSLGGSGTASLSISSLAVGVSRIQAVYNGVTNDRSSVSSILAQTVSPLATATVLSLSGELKTNGQTRYVLVATTTSTAVGLVPSGTVVFRKNGHVIGSAKLKNGTAVLALGRRGAQGGRFVARFLGSARFRPSNSNPISAG